MGPLIATDLDHQTKYLEWCDKRQYDGLFADPGTGKTRMTLRRAMIRFKRGEIDALVVTPPNSVKTGWVAWPHMLEEDDCDEVTKHLGDEDVLKGVWVSNASGKDRKAWEQFERDLDKWNGNKLIVLVLNYEALLSDQFFNFLTAFMKKYRTQFSLDESTRIGKPGSRRTKRATKLAPLAVTRTILTGTPILKSPLKIYSQAKFLSPQALGYTSFFPFRNRYCVMGGFEGRQVVDFVHLDELSAKIASFSYSVKATDCLDLPPPDYKKHAVYMTPEQARAYRTMREEFYAHVDGTEITAPIVLAQMTRLQQITGGFLSKDDRIIPLIPPEQNPKVLEAADIVDECGGQYIIWFRFREELAAMAAYLAAQGEDFFEFHGGLDDKEKLAVRKMFKKGQKRGVLGITSAGGIGIDEFKVADTAIFFSNDFDTEQRRQAELRTMRYGSNMHKVIRYHDIFVPNTVDTKIMRVLREDAQLSARIMRERWKDWI